MSSPVTDPYVKVYLLCQGKRIKKKKTTVKKATLNPVYNEALVFDVPADNVEEVSLIVKVIDYDRIGHNELMGCTAIGSSFIGIGRDHWLEMLDNPRKPVAQWYPLLETVPGQIPVTCSQPLPVNLSCLNGSFYQQSNDPQVNFDVSKLLAVSGSSFLIQGIFKSFSNEVGFPSLAMKTIAFSLTLDKTGEAERGIRI
uniref:C2 domain-containing protein n=1 Tax=Timema douglasi TaxID=61478 RepID=A0A7R8VET8_TIMDO|nr:unnamed protein product [Timema douglasi]